MKNSDPLCLLSLLNAHEKKWKIPTNLEKFAFSTIFCLISLKNIKRSTIHNYDFLKKKRKWEKETKTPFFVPRDLMFAVAKRIDKMPKFLNKMHVHNKKLFERTPVTIVTILKSSQIFSTFQKLLFHKRWNNLLLPSKSNFNTL